MYSLGKQSLIAGSSSEELSEKLATKLNMRIIRTQDFSFPDGENKITLHGTLSDQEIVVVQSMYPPVNTNLVRALSLVARAREAAPKVTAIIPYMGYARQDRAFLTGEIITMKVLARLFKCAGATKIVVVDMHSKAGLKHFKIKTLNITAIPELVKYFKKMRLKNPLVISPDKGGAGRAAEFAERLKTDHIILAKQRNRKTGKVQITTKDPGHVKGRDMILVDDMISTGGSIISAAKLLKRQKCGKIYVACTHGLLVEGAEKKIKKAGVTKIISTNTIPGNTAVVDISLAIARAVR